MKKTSGLLLCMCLALLAAKAVAADACYAPGELQAEQLLRLHSELMVITVTCRRGSDGGNLVPVYTGFTHAHVGELHNAEQTMMRYYSANYGGDGVAKLDTIRTRLANEVGQKVAYDSPPVFCRKYRDKVEALGGYDSDDLQAEVERMTESEKSYGHLCAD